MAEIERIGVDEARSRVQAGQALLVCAYDDDEKCRKLALQGAIPLSAFKSHLPSLSRDQEIIFYCA